MKFEKEAWLKQNNLFKKRTAFTLIELLIVIAIIAILAAAIIIAVNPGEQLAKARDATRERHVNAVESAIYTYHIDNLEFPADLANSLGSEICNTNITPSNECGDLIDLSSLVEEGYLPQIPINPTTEKNTSSTGYNIATVEDKVAVWPTESETRLVGNRLVLEFDGEEIGNYREYVNVGNPEDLKTSNMLKFSVSVWGLIGEEHGTFVYKGQHTARTGWGIYKHSTIRFQFSDTHDGYDQTLSDSFGNEGKWTYLVLIINKEKNILEGYMDGKLVGSMSIDSINDVSDQSSFLFGAQGGSYWNLKGMLRDIRIYNRALSEEEIQALYNGQNITDGLVGHWPLSEGQGCIAYDHSGNNNHGTLEPDCPNNAPEWVIGR